MPKINLNENNITFSATQIRPEDGTKGVPAQVRVTTSPYRGKLKVHVREYYRNLDMEYVPGRGVNFTPEALEEIIQGLILAQQAIEEGGLLYLL